MHTTFRNRRERRAYIARCERALARRAAQAREDRHLSR